MPQSKRLNYYGFFGLWVALISLASYFVIYSRSCVETESNYLELIQIIGIIIGTIMFIMSFFSVASNLYDFKFCFYSIVAIILVIGCIFFYGAYKALLQTCDFKMYYERNFQLLKNYSRYKFDETTVENYFERKYGHNIVLFIFDFINGLLIWAIGYTFRRRV